jgi:hypothetical protein
MRVLPVLAILVVAIACSSSPPAGYRGPEEGDSGGSGGTGGGAPGGSGGEPDCGGPIPCWLEGDEGWLPAPGALPTDICQQEVGVPEAIPATTLSWEPCGPGCTRATAALLGEDDLEPRLLAMRRIDLDGVPTVVLRTQHRHETPAGGFRAGRVVRLPDGATLGALRGRYDPAQPITDACNAGIFDLRDPRIFDLRIRRSWGGTTDVYRDAIWLPGGEWMFREDWREDPTYEGATFLTLLGGASPVILGWGDEGLQIQLDPASGEWTAFDPEAPLSRPPNIASDDGLAVWGTDWTGSRHLRTWSRNGSPREGPTLPELACALAVGDDFLAAHVPPPGHDCRDWGSDHHRLWIGPRSGEAAGLLHTLRGGRAIGMVSDIVGYDDHVAIQISGGDLQRGAVLVFRRSDGQERMLVSGFWAEAIALDGTSLYIVGGGAPDGTGDAIHRYDLSRLEEWTEPVD